MTAKNKERPVPVWMALEVTALPAARPLGTAPLVGRDEELARLSDLWLRVVRDRQPHLVTVLGEPGIGKSRLVTELKQGIGVRPTSSRSRSRSRSRLSRFENENENEKEAPNPAPLWLEGRCLPYGEALGYWAAAMALKEAVGITAEDDPETARARLGDRVAGALAADASDVDPDEVARHLALLTGLDRAEDRSPAGVDQRLLHASLRRFLEALARRQPLCLVIEDIHWADDALLDLIEFVASHAQAAPLLILTQARPELLENRPAWGRDAGAFTMLPLAPLTERAGEELIAALCRERGIPAEVAAAAGRGAGGNPLFAEELVAMLADRGGSDGGAEGVPSLIKALISARLDALPPAPRRALQFASVFGKRFWVGGVRALGAPGDLTRSLELLERKDLLRAQPASQVRGEREYSFKHDLIRDVAYETLPRAERRRLHGQAADWMEQAVGELADDYLDLLAHHVVQADQPERALDCLVRAAARARRAAAHRQEAALLAQAIAIAERLGRDELVADLHARRGTAFRSITLWADARRELEAALNALAPECRERRAEVLVDLAWVCFSSLDIPSMRRYTTEALVMAQAVERTDLATHATAWLATADGSDGELVTAIDGYRRAVARAADLSIELRPHTPGFYSLTLYWTGQMKGAVEIGREAVRLARGLNDTEATNLTLGFLGLALAGDGQYVEAQQVFDEARRFGREYGVDVHLARCIAMSAGYHLDLFDFAGAEALAEEAREMARSLNFAPPLVSAGIDLLLSFARREEVGRAEKLVDGVAEGVAKAVAWHGWLWKMRLSEARAELALVRGKWEEALRWADMAIAQSRAKGRVKYQVAGLESRARALAALGRKHEAIADLRSAVALARPVGDPAMFLRAASALLEMEGDDMLVAQARSAVARITAALPKGELRRHFEAADPVRRLEQ